MQPSRTLRVEIVGLALLLAAAAGWHARSSERASRPIQLAQEVFGEPVGAMDGSIGGPTMYGEPVGSRPIDSPSLYGEPVGSRPIDSPALYGEPVGSGSIDSPALYGEPVGMGGDGAPIGGAPLY